MSYSFHGQNVLQQFCKFSIVWCIILEYIFSGIFKRLKFMWYSYFALILLLWCVHPFPVALLSLYVVPRLRESKY